MGKQRKYIFSYFGMFSDYIHDFDFFFWFAWCLGAEKMWESRGNVQNSLAKELYIVSYTTFETIKETSISSFRNSRSILELDSKRLAGRV